MGWWDYTNIGASASRQNQKHIEKIFEYMGYASEADHSPDGGKRTFDRPAVYYCMRSVNPGIEEQIREVKELQYGVKALRDLLNALFPKTIIYLHSASGNNTSDTWKNSDEIYVPQNMTCYSFDSHTYEGRDRPVKSWKSRFVLEPPPIAFIQALIDISANDGNAELTLLLHELAQKLRDHKIVYEDDGSDTRIISREYDVLKGDEGKSRFDSECREFFRNTKIEEYFDEMEGACKIGKPLWDMIEAGRKAVNANAYGDKDAFEQAIKNLDRNAIVTFSGKHFALTGFGIYEKGVIAEIEKRGGIVHSSMVKMADYLIVCLESPGAAKVKKALEWRQKGVSNLIVSDYQMWRAIFDSGDSKSKEEEEIAVARAAEKEARAAEKAAKEAARNAEKEKERKQRLQYQQEKKAAEHERKLKYEQEKKKEREDRENERKRMQALAAEEAAEKERRRQESIANVLYKPGNEPENIRRRINVLFPKLDAAYPNKQIIALYKDHKKWGETVTELYRLLGYPDGKAFLEAYGYTVVDNKGGRPASNNYDEAILELQRRYPNGSALTTVSALQAANPDLPIKSLANSSKVLYGISLGGYLKKKGILS